MSLTAMTEAHDAVQKAYTALAANPTNADLYAAWIAARRTFTALRAR